MCGMIFDVLYKKETFVRLGESFEIRARAHICTDNLAVTAPRFNMHMLTHNVRVPQLDQRYEYLVTSN